MPRPTTREITKPWLKDLADEHGGVTHFSRAIGVRPGAVSNWLYTDLKIGHRAAYNIQLLTNKKFNLFHTRPDLYTRLPIDGKHDDAKSDEEL